jgi:hypothetical protein
MFEIQDGFFRILNLNNSTKNDSLNNNPNANSKAKVLLLDKEDRNSGG